MTEQAICSMTLYFMNDRAILPTEADIPSGFSMSIEPVSVFDYRNRSEFIAALEKTIERGNPQIAEPPESEIVRNSKGIPASKNPVELQYAKFDKWDDLERNSIYATIDSYPSGFLVQVFGRAKNGKWSDVTPLEVRLLDVGVPVVVDVILEHLKTRHDLSNTMVKPSKRGSAKGA